MLIDMDNGKVYGTVMQEAARDVFVCFAGMTDIWNVETVRPAIPKDIGQGNAEIKIDLP